MHPSKPRVKHNILKFRNQQNSTRLSQPPLKFPPKGVKHDLTVLYYKYFLNTFVKCHFQINAQTQPGGMS
jgi:hypothetical protein